MQKKPILIITIFLLLLSISCERTDLWDVSDTSNTPDQTAPIPGGNGTISTANTLAESINLTWTKATDNSTMQANLQYKVFKSSNNNITNVISAESNGMELTSGWATNIASFNVTNLAQNTTNYFNVIVMDQASNKSAYTSMAASTTTYPTVAVSNISTNCRIHTGFLIGTSSSTIGTIVSVEVQFDGGAYTAATGTVSWKMAIPNGASTWLKGTQHTINIRSKDNVGNYSSVLSTTVFKGINKDVNGDGYADVAIGEDGYTNYRGRAYLYHGSPSGISASPDTTLLGEEEENLFGDTVAFGDLNGDGYADFIIGARIYPTNQGWGRVYIFYGGPSGVANANASAAPTILDGEFAATENFSGALAVGDVNGDGYQDLAVGAPTGAGEVYIFHGGPSGIATMNAGSANTKFTGEAGSNMGGSISFGDVNGDGYEDIAMGAYVYNSYQGRVYVFHGGPGGIASAGAGSADTIFTGESTDNSFGAAIALGDITGDGYADIAMGAYYINNERGRAYIFHGAPGGIASAGAGSANTILDGEAGITNRFGVRIVTADVNRDGYMDIAIGASSYSTFKGRIFIHLGSASGINTSALRVYTAGASYTYYGSMMGFSDWNSDGYPDFMIGYPRWNSHRGIVELFNGSATGPSATADGTRNVADPCYHFGSTVNP